MALIDIVSQADEATPEALAERERRQGQVRIAAVVAPLVAALVAFAVARRRFR